MTDPTYDLTELWKAKRDRYATRQGAFVLKGEVTLFAPRFDAFGRDLRSESVEVWNFMRACRGKIMRIIYVCLDGTVRDMIGRQGVHDSDQDGAVQGTGHSMADSTRLNLSFWTFAHGKKVNTGSGQGYRTLRAEGILAIRCEGNDILTAYGQGGLEQAARLVVPREIATDTVPIVEGEYEGLEI